MGRKWSEESKIQVKDQGHPKINVKYCLNQEKSTEKKPIHTDTESVAESEGSIGSACGYINILTINWMN
jgi:hypothetical protein